MAKIQNTSIGNAFQAFSDQEARQCWIYACIIQKSGDRGVQRMDSATLVNDLLRASIARAHHA